jgi:hypothetical protein
MTELLPREALRYFESFDDLGNGDPEGILILQAEEYTGSDNRFHMRVPYFMDLKGNNEGPTAQM